MTRRQLLVLGAVLIGLFLLLRLPLSVMTGSSLPSGLSASGTVWNGAIDGLKLPQSPPTRLTVNARPFSLLTATLAADVAFDGVTAQGDGRLIRSLSGAVRIKEANFRVDVSSLTLPLPLFGQLEGRIKTLSLGPDMTCLDAAGRLTSDTLVRSSANWGWPGPSLTGAITCDGDRLTGRLEGASEGTTVEIDLSLDGRRREGFVRVAIGDPTIALAFALEEAGFKPDTDTRLIWKQDLKILGEAQ